MTELQARIDRVMELDNKRSQGNWKYMEEGKRFYKYISKNGTRQLDDAVIYDDGSYPVDGNDMRFIAAAPEMVSIIKELQAQLSANRIQISAYKSLLKSMDETEPTYRRKYYEQETELNRLKAIAETVESERAMNAQLTQELSAKDAIIQRYEFKKDDEADVRAGLFRDLTNMKAIAEKKIAEKDALIAELQKENEWQDIASAPKDGTVILGAVFEDGNIMYVRKSKWRQNEKRWGFFTPDGKAKITEYSLHHDFTHWKKIEPPKGI